MSAQHEEAGASRPSGSEEEALLAQLNELETDLAIELADVQDDEDWTSLLLHNRRYAPGTPHGDYKLRKQGFTFKPGDIVTYDPFSYQESAEAESAVGSASGSSFWNTWDYLAENEGRLLIVVHVSELDKHRQVWMTVMDRSELVTQFTSEHFRPFYEEGFKPPTT